MILNFFFKLIMRFIHILFHPIIFVGIYLIYLFVIWIYFINSIVVSISHQWIILITLWTILFFCFLGLFIWINQKTLNSVHWVIVDFLNKLVFDFFLSYINWLGLVLSIGILLIIGGYWTGWVGKLIFSILLLYIVAWIESKDYISIKSALFIYPFLVFLNIIQNYASDFFESISDSLGLLYVIYFLLVIILVFYLGISYPSLIFEKLFNLISPILSQIKDFWIWYFPSLFPDAPLVVLEHYEIIFFGSIGVFTTLVYLTIISIFLSMIIYVFLVTFLIYYFLLLNIIFFFIILILDSIFFWSIILLGFTILEYINLITFCLFILIIFVMGFLANKFL